MAVTQDILCTEYTEFDNNISSFYGDQFISKIKDIIDCNINFWHQKYSPPCTKVLGFVACRFISKVLGIVEAENLWGDVKTIKYVMRSDISSDVSEIQIIVYTSACIESAIIESYHSDKQLNYNCSSHTWNK